MEDMAMARRLLEKVSSTKVELFPRPDGKWDWRFRGRNGRVRGGSHSQGFRAPNEARRAVVGLLDDLGVDLARVVIVQVAS